MSPLGLFQSKPDVQKMAAERDIKGLLELIQEQNEKFARERSQAAQVLLKMADPRSVKPLASMLKSPDGVTRTLAASALAFTKDPVALKALCETLKHNDRSARAAAKALAQAADPRTLKPLMSAAAKGNFEAVLALEQIGDPRAAPALVHLINDPSEAFLFSEQHKQVAHALKKLGWQPDDSDASLYYSLYFVDENVDTIVAFGPAAVDLLLFVLSAEGDSIGTFKYDDNEARQNAASALGYIHRADVLDDETVEKLLKQDDIVIWAHHYDETKSNETMTTYTKFSDRYQLKWYLEEPELRKKPFPEIVEQRHEYH